MNKRGYFTSTSIFICLIISSVFMALSFTPIYSLMFSLKNPKETTEEFVDRQTGIERLNSKMRENIAFKNDINFEDININYNIFEKLKEVEQIDIGPSFATSNFDDVEASFNVLNPTDIKISFEYTNADSTMTDSYYHIDLLKDNVSVLNESLKENITSSSQINIPSSFLYNEETDKNNFGIYTLKIGTVNSNINFNISYENLKYREVEITENNNIKRTMVIENEFIDFEKIKIYFK